MAGHGHTYTRKFVDGWATILEPAGWTPTRVSGYRTSSRRPSDRPRRPHPRIAVPAQIRASSATAAHRGHALTRSINRIVIAHSSSTPPSHSLVITTQCITDDACRSAQRSTRNSSEDSSASGDALLAPTGRRKQQQVVAGAVAVGRRAIAPGEASDPVMCSRRS
jgi:hypothetical protein